MLGNYIQLVGKIDLRSAAIHQRWGDHMACRKGCDHCCRHITIFPVEAAHLARALAAAPPSLREAIRISARQATPDGACPLLAGGACRLYHARPVICRTQGLPLLVRNGDEVSIDFCPLNFHDIAHLPKDSVLDMERLNEMLAAVNALFIRRMPPGPPVPERISLAEALLAPSVGIDG